MLSSHASWGVGVSQEPGELRPRGETVVSMFTANRGCARDPCRQLGADNSSFQAPNSAPSSQAMSPWGELPC